ncbi:LOW QUALITY PROTEIN: CMP-sialic acid transporter 1-like [Carya illinoinensis]|uniref:LOW QUALITY PROTEIN: CMP-sialic acid transporter 1-like n=1 Tax=Carya illinoinensis TaxID=32201 RepID=UPI001C71E7BB|nr:LOW QUALITY PROTEIN: CMP-sialic acid transporter 1-like [Carya illinoinensis]
MQWYFVAALLTILTSSQGILTTLSQSNGRYLYDYATVPFLAEVFKLVVSSLLLWQECRVSPSTRMTTDWKSVRLFPIPSVIYLVHNNVQFATLTYVDTSTYQIMGNLKIVTTALLFRLFLRRKLSNIQWMAICLLAVGTTTSQIKGCGEASCDSLFSAPIQGYMLGILSACLSALAGVYTEFLMKKNNDSLYWQNVQLYTFGAIFNMARLLADDFRGGFENGPWWHRIFDGYSITTWMVVLNLGSTGLLVSWLMKYADNIVKVYSTSMAMLLTMVLSVYLFNFKPALQLFLGIIICMMSLHMYFAPPNILVDLPSTTEASYESLKEVCVEPRTDSCCFSCSRKLITFVRCPLEMATNLLMNCHLWNIWRGDTTLRPSRSICSWKPPC